MKQATVFGFLATLTAAAQHHRHQHAPLHKRALVTETDTVVVWDVVTKTVYGSSSSAAAAPVYDTASSSTSKTTTVTVAASSANVVQASSSSAAVVQPAAESAKAYTKPAPAPSSVPVKQSSAAPVAAPPASSSAAPAPQSYGSSGPAPNAGSLLSGDITYYDATGLSTCGYELSNSNNTAAIAIGKFGGVSNYGLNQPASPLCNKKINIYPDGPTGKAVEVFVADACQACGENDLDLPTDFFKSIMPSKGSEDAMTVGRFAGVPWEWA